MGENIEWNMDYGIWNIEDWVYESIWVGIWADRMGDEDSDGDGGWLVIGTRRSYAIINRAQPSPPYHTLALAPHPLAATPLNTQMTRSAVWASRPPRRNQSSTHASASRSRSPVGKTSQGTAGAPQTSDCEEEGCEGEGDEGGNGDGDGDINSSTLDAEYDLRIISACCVWEWCGEGGMSRKDWASRPGERGEETSLLRKNLYPFSSTGERMPPPPAPPPSACTSPANAKPLNPSAWPDAEGEDSVISDSKSRGETSARDDTRDVFVDEDVEDVDTDDVDDVDVVEMVESVLVRRDICGAAIMLVDIVLGSEVEEQQPNKEEQITKTVQVLDQKQTMGAAAQFLPRFRWFSPLKSLLAKRDVAEMRVRAQDNDNEEGGSIIHIRPAGLDN
ncbi:hypothetical protein BD410DRAFT_805190 [Rickenella mellea]|uniref:Uncharacterized protein n=1 Tax=Rickenella mellea TaxID=50990 RepID=A0A4Y7PYI8_9AGAM|nr:hypothetical protein BD410DRAFT_805190 [Rickenella mellea]